MIDWSLVNWMNVAVLSGIAFVAALLGNLIPTSRLTSALLTALVFAALYIVWTYYPHGMTIPAAKVG